MTNAPPATSAGCSTGCARTCRPPTPPRSPSPGPTWAPTVLGLLQRWPTQPELAAATRDELVSFARAGRHGWPDRFADQVPAALATPSLPTRDYLVQAKV